MTENFHMDAEEFRRHGHELVEWIGAYMTRVGELPIDSAVAPGDIANMLPLSAPEDPEPFEDVLKDLDRIVVPGITQWQSPGWFGYYPANTSGASILGEFASAALGVQGMIWSSSPACTEIESRVVDWLVDLLGLPDGWKTSVGPGGGVIQSSASDSTHLVHVVARLRASKRGADVSKFVAYASSEAHSSVEKAARVAGIPHFRKIGVDSNLAMNTDSLEATVMADIAAGLIPLIMTTSIGTTSTAAVDPAERTSVLAKRFGIWQHIDAAYAGSAMICPEKRVLQKGIEGADSYTFNPHKWMFTNFDCNILYVADRGLLTESMSINPPYLDNAATASGDVIDYRDWQVPLGRRFRSLKLWWVLRSYGATGIRHHIREHMRLAEELGARVVAHESLELVAPVSFGLVSFRHRDGGPATERVLDSINSMGTVYVTPSVANGERFIRISVGQTWTTEAEIERLWESVGRAA